MAARVTNSSRTRPPARPPARPHASRTDPPKTGVVGEKTKGWAGQGDGEEEESKDPSPPLPSPPQRKGQVVV